MNSQKENNQNNGESDNQLVASSIQGDKKSLEKLIIRHRPYIYNVAWKMVLSPVDAEDVTQEVLIKVITHLSKFEAKSEFTTWLYRIVVNHVLHMKKRQMENLVSTFENYFDELENMPDTELTASEKIELEETIEEVQIGCTMGMLLCLDREQRMILVLGDIFEIDHNLGAEIFNISPDNFRQKLSRARKELYNWMNDKCGLVNHNNPCSCPKKTRAFIQLGYVDPHQLKFNNKYQNRIKEIILRDVTKECATIEDLHQSIFHRHPFKETVNGQTIVDEILNNPEVKRIYNF